VLARCPYEFRPLVAGRRARGSYAPRRAGPTWLHRMSAEIAAFAASVQNPARIEGDLPHFAGEDRGEPPTRPLRLVRGAVAVRAGPGSQNPVTQRNRPSRSAPATLVPVATTASPGPTAAQPKRATPGAGCGGPP